MPGAVWSDALHDSHSGLRGQKTSYSLENLRPPNQGEQQGRTVPYIVKRNYEGAEVQQKEALEEGPGGTPSGESLIEGDPGFGLTKVRKANH